MSLFPNKMEPGPVSDEASKKPHPGEKLTLMEALEDIFHGSVAGIVGKYIEYPFDTVKVRLQSQPEGSTLLYKGPLDCFQQSIRAEGFLSLYRGISAPLLGAAAENSSLFLFESLGRESLYLTGLCSRHERIPLPALYATGAFAGLFTSFVLTPIELVKCRIQVPTRKGSSVPTSPLRPLPVIRDIYRHEGFKGFWHGQLGTLIREMGGGAAWFGAKETVTAYFHKRRTQGVSAQSEVDRLLSLPLPLWQQALAGAAAGVSYNFLFFPADTIKSRMQTTPMGGSKAKRTFLAEGTRLWQEHGMRGMYRGCGITCLRSAPSSAFIFMVYDGLKRYFPFSDKR